MIGLIKRKIASASVKFLVSINKFILQAYAFFNGNIVCAYDVIVGRAVSLRASDGGSIFIGKNVSLADGVRIISSGGRICIGNNVFIGVGTIIVAQYSIEIQDDTQIAEYVVIRDQDHRTDSSPIRSAGFHTSPIQIGSDVWIGCKATILRGVNIGQHSVVAAHSVVKNDVPCGVLVAGIPARIIKKIS